MSDAAVREYALDPSRSILLQAPAGSGKTTVLAQRFLRLLATVDEPEELLAITFTRKAAAEMRERVLSALDGTLAARGAVGEVWARLRGEALAQAQARGWQIADLGARLRIQTIDSFHHEIARSMPVLGNFQGNMQVVDDASALHRAAARRTLRRIDSDTELQQDADVLLERLDNNLRRAEDLIADLLEARSSWLPLVLGAGPEGLAQAVVESLRHIVHASLQEMQQMPADILEEGSALLRASARHRLAEGQREDRWCLWLEDSTRLCAEPDALAAWQSLVDLALTSGSDGALRKVIDKRAGFPATDKALKARWISWRESLERIDDIEHRLHRVRALPPAILSSSDRAATAALARILLVAAEELQWVFRERGRVDHGQVASTARQALIAEGQPTDLAIHHTLRIRHLLVDEFQDVSPSQLQLIAALTSGWSEADGRSLFLVGDPMQSIYLFRQSEVGLFLRTRERGVGDLPLEALQLRGNFRSRPALVDFANQLFGRCFPREENLRASAVAFLASEAAREAGAAVPAAVEFLPLSIDDADREAQWIAEEILRTRRTSPDSRMAVLVRERRYAPPILKALQAAGVTVRGVALASLAQHQTVLDLVALGSALLHEADRSAWLAVLRSPCCGLSLADLHALCGSDERLPLVSRLDDSSCWTEVSADGRTRLARVAPLLVAAWQQRQRLELADSLEMLWNALGGEMLATAEGRHAAAQDRSALRRLALEEPAIDGEALKRLAARLRDTPPQTVAEGEPPPVEVLTVHHSKGLEWDVVFVPGLGRPSPNERTPLMRWLELPAAGDRLDLLLAVHSIGEAGESDPLSRYIAGLSRERLRNEQFRLAYVAFTRARERLVLSGHARQDPESGEPRPEKRSLLGLLWPALRVHFDASSLPDEEEGSQASAAPLPIAVPTFRRAIAAFDPAAGRTVLAPPRSLDAGSDVLVDAPEYTWVGPRARAEGTVVHAVLEAIARSGDWTPVGSARLHARVTRQLIQLGVSTQDAATLTTEIMSRLETLQLQPRAQWLLSPGHRDAHCELRLTGVVDGRLRNIVIDRSFVDDAGQRWVVDYKTSTHTGGGLDEFLARELDRYRPQLELYRALASRLGPEPVRAALYFPWLGEWRELDAHSPASEKG